MMPSNSMKTDTINGSNNSIASSESTHGLTDSFHIFQSSYSIIEKLSKSITSRFGKAKFIR